MVTDDGHVVDFTHEQALKKTKLDYEDDDTIQLYLGLNVPRTFILEHVLEGGRGEPIAERYSAGTKPDAREVVKKCISPARVMSLSRATFKSRLIRFSE